MAFKFKGVDFIGFDTLLSEDERLVRDTARQFIEDNLIPIIEECNRDGRFPKELIRPMGELGFYGATIEGYGCAGMNNVEYGLVMQETERQHDREGGEVHDAHAVDGDGEKLRLEPLAAARRARLLHHQPLDLLLDPLRLGLAVAAFEVGDHALVGRV